MNARISSSYSAIVIKELAPINGFMIHHFSRIVLQLKGLVPMRLSQVLRRSKQGLMNKKQVLIRNWM
jgi:hypothetical protein